MHQVRLNKRDGRIRAEVTGEFFFVRPGDSIGSKRAFLEGMSPTYFISKKVQSEAARALRGYAPFRMSSCRAGRGGRPCGDVASCQECRDAADIFFTMRIIDGIASECSQESLAGRIMKAVSSVIGGTEVNVDIEDEGLDYE